MLTSRVSPTGMVPRFTGVFRYTQSGAGVLSGDTRDRDTSSRSARPLFSKTMVSVTVSSRATPVST